MSSLPTDYQTFIHTSRYARWLDEEQRRETWQETVQRFTDYMEEHVKLVCDVALTKFPENRAVRDGILSLNVMPSMRALMTA